MQASSLYTVPTTSLIVPAGTTASFQVQGIALQPGSTITTQPLSLAFQPLPADLVRTVLYYGIDWGYSLSNPLQVALAVWYARDSTWHDTEHTTADRIYSAAASSGIPSWSPLGRSALQLAASGELSLGSISFTPLPTGGSIGTGSLAVTNNSSQDLTVYLPYGTVFGTDSDSVLVWAIGIGTGGSGITPTSGATVTGTIAVATSTQTQQPAGILSATPTATIAQPGGSKKNTPGAIATTTATATAAIASATPTDVAKNGTPPHKSLPIYTPVSTHTAITTDTPYATPTTIATITAVLPLGTPTGTSMPLPVTNVPVPASPTASVFANTANPAAPVQVGSGKSQSTGTNTAGNTGKQSPAQSGSPANSGNGTATSNNMAQSSTAMEVPADGSDTVSGYNSVDGLVPIVPTIIAGHGAGSTAEVPPAVSTSRPVLPSSEQTGIATVPVRSTTAPVIRTTPVSASTTVLSKPAVSTAATGIEASVPPPVPSRMEGSKLLPAPVPSKPVPASLPTGQPVVAPTRLVDTAPALPTAVAGVNTTNNGGAAGDAGDAAGQVQTSSTGTGADSTVDAIPQAAPHTGAGPSSLPYWTTAISALLVLLGWQLKRASARRTPTSNPPKQ